MITEAEFVAIRAFDATLDRYERDATAIINRKNANLELLACRIADLEAELEQERARRRRAEFLLNRH